jgi:hypothetical protein
MDKILEFLRAWFVSVYKMTETEVTSLFNEENFDPTAALTAIKEKDKTRVASFSGKFQEGINKGKAESLKAFETEVKAKYGIQDSDPENPLQGVALVDAIIAAKAGETVTGDISKLTAEDLRKLPAFQTIQREHTTALNKAKKEAEDKISEIEKGHARQQSRAEVGKDILKQLDGMNPVLPKVPTAAEKQRNSFLNDVLGEYDWERRDGVFLPIGKDGKVATDEHGNALTIDGLTKTKASEWFEFAANNGGRNAGNGKPGEGGQGGGSAGGNKGYPAGIVKPKTFEDVSKIVNDTSIKAEDRQTVLQVWEAEQAK